MEQVSRCLASGFEVTAIEHDVRVVLAMPPGLSSAEQQQALLEAERRLRSEVDPRLEVYAEPRRDQNKIRRLAVVEGA